MLNKAKSDGGVLKLKSLPGLNQIIFLMMVLGFLCCYFITIILHSALVSNAKIFTSDATVLHQDSHLVMEKKKKEIFFRVVFWGVGGGGWGGGECLTKLFVIFFFF